MNPIETAQSARRHRQVTEIGGLIVAGAHDRAEGLALIHTAEFPEDAELLAALVALGALCLMPGCGGSGVDPYSRR
jgi:hypothetical protein